MVDWLRLRAWFAAAALLMGAGDAAAQATAAVSLTISAINEISVSGTATLVVDTATPGSEPNEQPATGATYSITTNEAAKKITGALNSAMPSNTTLKINLTAPTGASSAGDVALSTVASDLVTGITRVAQSALGITLKLSATVAAGVVSPGSRTVTLTVL